MGTQLEGLTGLTLEYAPTVCHRCVWWQSSGRPVDGWNGDSLSVVRCGSAAGLADRWETDPGVDASRLFNALSQWAGTWAGNSRAPGADGRFSGPNGSGRITRSGSHVDLVLAADSATVDRLVRALS